MLAESSHYLPVSRTVSTQAIEEIILQRFSLLTTCILTVNHFSMFDDKLVTIFRGLIFLLNNVEL